MRSLVNPISLVLALSCAGCGLFIPYHGYTADLKGGGITPAIPMVAKPLPLKLVVIMDPAKVADEFPVHNVPEGYPPNEVKGFRSFVERSLRNTLAGFFTEMVFVQPGFDTPDEPHLVADVKMGAFENSPKQVGKFRHDVLKMGWAFALRAAGEADYRFSFSGTASSQDTYDSLDIGCQQLLLSAMQGLLQAWADKDVQAALAGQGPKAADTPVDPATLVIVAVFDVRDASNQIDQATLVQTTDFLSALLTTTGKFSVVPRDQLRARLMDEKKGSYRACVDEGCQIELGKAMAAQKTLSTTLIKVGGQCAVTSSLFDLKTETAQQGATVETGCEPDALLGAMKKIVAQLTAAGS